MSTTIAPPAAMSLDDDSPHFSAAAVGSGRLSHVFLDGVEVPHVRAYDCIEGWVDYFQSDEHGKKRYVEVLEINDQGVEQLVDIVACRRRAHGKVTVVWRPGVTDEQIREAEEHGKAREREFGHPLWAD